MKRSAVLEFDDGEVDLDDQVDVEAFIRKIERQDRKRDRIAWREIERRQERRLLANHLDDYYKD